MASFPDRVSIVACTIDPVTGATVKAAAFETKAFYEESNALRYDAKGTPYMRQELVFLPGTVSVKLGDEVKPVRVKGQTITDGRYSKIKQVHRCGGQRRVSHIEVET